MLEANGPPPYPTACRLYTCSVRPGAIYGEHDQRHLPRIAKLAALGLGRVAVGAASAKQDWLHVDNLVDALVLAAVALDPLGERKGVAAGRT